MKDVFKEGKVFFSTDTKCISTDLYKFDHNWANIISILLITYFIISGKSNTNNKVWS